MKYAIIIKGEHGGETAEELKAKAEELAAQLVADGKAASATVTVSEARPAFGASQPVEGRDLSRLPPMHPLRRMQEAARRKSGNQS